MRATVSSLLSWVMIGMAVVMLAALPAAAQDTPKDGAVKDKLTPKVFAHAFSGTFNGQRVDYTVTAGETFLKNDKGEDNASIFTIAYTKKDVGDPRTRPVTFVFNGGPGSSSLWLHMGVFGPKQVQVPSDATSAGAPPYTVSDNPLSILDVTDLVFIDPVGTGYSKALGTAKDENFFGLREDTQSIANFIQVWITKNGRWNSPRYLAGESYGTMRAAQIVSELQGGYTGVFLNGVILLSSVLDFHAINFERGNDLPYITFLPSYAAAAWYHGKVEPKPESLPAFLAEARAFAQNEYSVALLKGAGLSDPARDDIVKKLARYTGLSETYIRRADLRISAFRFMKELLRDKGVSMGRYDARYTGEDYDNAGETFDADPSAYGVSGAYVATVNDYLTRVLKVDMDRRYKILDGEPSGKWKWADPGSQTTLNNFAPNLGRAMRENKDFRILMASGYYDLATPFFASEIAVAGNGISPERVTLAYYEAGHMMYTHRPSLEKLATDVRAFIKAGRP
jgi:carboxypeptidase C (cathepsin A)